MSSDSNEFNGKVHPLTGIVIALVIAVILGAGYISWKNTPAAEEHAVTETHQADAHQQPEAAPSKESEDLSVISPAPDKPLAALQVSFQGTGHPGGKIEIYAGGLSKGKADVGEDGRWTIPVVLSEPIPKDFSVVQRGPQGEDWGKIDGLKYIYSTMPISDDFTLDKPTPNSIIDTPEVTFEGTGKIGSTVIITADGAQIANTIVGNDNRWRVPVTITLPAPEHFSISMQDKDGGSQGSIPDVAYEIQLSADGGNREFAVTRPQDLGILKVGGSRITGTGKPYQTVKVTLDGKPVGETKVDGGGYWVLDHSFGDAAKESMLEAAEYDGTTKGRTSVLRVRIVQ